MIILSTSTSHITYGYMSRIVPFEQIRDITAKYNYSAATFKGGHRHRDKVLSLGNVMIYDHDDGAISLDEMETFLRDNKVTSMIATSRNHLKEKKGKPACHRFRLFLPLHRPLKIQLSEYSDFYDFVAKLLDIHDAIDGVCKDASRFYFPNPSQEVRYIKTGWVLDTDILEKNFRLIQESKEKERQKVKAAIKVNYTPSTGRKRNEISRDTQIEMRNGEIRYLYEFDYLQGDETIPCRCINPTHEDKHPSAFVGRSKSGGGLQVTCSGCGFTAYMEREVSHA